MPLTDYQKSWALQQAGLDPSKYTLGDDGYAAPISDKQPGMYPASMVPNKPSPTPAGTQYSPLATGAMSFAQAAPSAVGGGVGGGLGLLAGGALAPETGGLSMLIPLLGMIGGGIAGSAGAKKIQSAIEPQQWQQAVQTAQQQNPKSAIAGELASLPLGGFSPSPSGVVRGLGAGAKLLTGMEATAPEMGALRNLAFNTALGGAQPTLNYLTGQGPAPTVGSSLESAGIGALFNKPNAIGNRLGFGAPEIPHPLSKEELTGALQTQQPQQPNLEPLAMAPQDITPQQKQAQEVLTESQQREVDFQKAQNDLRAEQIRQASLQRAMLSKQNDALQQQVQISPNQYINPAPDLSGLSIGNNVGRPEVIPQEAISHYIATPEGNKLASVGLTDQNLPTVTPKESQTDLANRQAEAQASGEPAPKYQEQSAFPNKLVAPDHLSVKEAIDTLQKKTDDASISEEDANELHKVLSLQVDWSKMPAVGDTLKSRGFDVLDPVSWEKVQDEYNKYLNAPKIQETPKADIAPTVQPAPAEVKVSRTKEAPIRAKNPPLTGEKALQSITGNAPKPIGANDLQPREGERISANSSEGLKQIWNDIDAGNHRAAMNRIEYAYPHANPDTKQVILAQMHLLGKKGIEPSEQFKTDNPRYQDEPAFQKQVNQKLTDKGIPTENVKEWNDVISKWAKPRFGIEIHDDGSIVNSTTGKPVAGAAYLRNSLREAFVKINPDKAGIDTLPHELHHVFMDYLDRFGSASDKKFIQDAYTKTEATPEYKAAKAKNPALDPNEFLASRGGLEFINRQLNLEGNNEWKTFWKDYLSHLKTKFTKTGTMEDYSRLLNYKMIYDPLHEGSAFNGVNPNAGAAKNQSEDGLKREGNKIELNSEVNSYKGPSNSKSFMIPHFKSTDHIIDWIKKNIDNSSDYEQFMRLAQHNEILYKGEAQRVREQLDPIYHKQIKEQDQSQIPKLSQHEQDIEDYRNLDNQRNALIKSGEAFTSDKSNFTPEFKDLWQRLEDIKNRNGGMPPKASEKFQDISEIYRAGGEGKTPYPFTLKELNKGENVKNDMIKQSHEEANLGMPLHLSENEARARELDTLYGPKEYTDLNKKNQDISFFRSELDKARDKVKESGLPKEAEAFHKAMSSLYPTKDNIYGKNMAPIVTASKGLSQADLDKVDSTLLQEQRTKTDLSGTLTPKQEKLYDAIRGSYANNQTSPYYHFNKASPKAIETLTEGSLADRNKLKQDFINHQVANGISTKDAETNLKNILRSYDNGKTNMSKFMALRTSNNVGLPDSWMRSGRLLQNLSNYFTRVGADRAWKQSVEDVPDVAKSLGVKIPGSTSTAQDITHIPEVRNAMEKFTGEPFTNDEATIKSLNRTATAFMLGPLTNIHIAAGSAANTIGKLHPGEVVPAFASAIKNLADNWEKVYETGYQKKDFTSIKDLVNNNLTGLEKLQSFASSIANLSGRDGMNHFTKSFLQGVGEYALRNRAIEANNGVPEAIATMKEADPNWSSGKTYTGKALDNLASNWASMIHGAHDIRTLPSWMLKDTAIQPFFSLASWNIAQTNAWMKHIWTPAMEGNWTPMLMSTLGSVLGGYVVKQMREGLADKKAPIPSLAELMHSDKGLKGNIPLVAYNLMSMASYTGFAGILSVAAKAGQDIAYKNIPQGAAFPLDEMISNPVHRTAQFLQAMYNDPTFDFLKAGPKLATDLVRENFQLGRVLENWTADKTNVLGENAHYEKNVNDALGDLRRFKMAEGLPYDEQTPSDSNPYTERTLKEFKRTQDVGEAAQDLPGLIQAAFTRANGNVEVLREQLQKIKQNTYETMPSPSNIPRTFLTYLNYLRDTQGDDVASERLTNYLMQEAINKGKSSMVPKF